MCLRNKLIMPTQILRLLFYSPFFLFCTRFTFVKGDESNYWVLLFWKEISSPRSTTLLYFRFDVMLVKTKLKKRKLIAMYFQFKYMIWGCRGLLRISYRSDRIIKSKQSNCKEYPNIHTTKKIYNDINMSILFNRIYSAWHSIHP